MERDVDFPGGRATNARPKRSSRRGDFRRIRQRQAAARTVFSTERNALELRSETESKLIGLQRSPQRVQAAAQQLSVSTLMGPGLQPPGFRSKTRPIVTTVSFE